MKPVLLATDGSPTAEKATETAIELAQLLGTELVVVTAWDLPYTAVGFAPVPVNGELAKLSEQEARKVCVEAWVPVRFSTTPDTWVAGTLPLPVI